jgi:hypothetical protein
MTRREFLALCCGALPFFLSASLRNTLFLGHPSPAHPGIFGGREKVLHFVSRHIYAPGEAQLTSHLALLADDPLHGEYLRRIETVAEKLRQGLIAHSLPLREKMAEEIIRRFQQGFLYENSGADFNILLDCLIEAAQYTGFPPRSTVPPRHFSAEWVYG